MSNTKRSQTIDLGSESSAYVYAVLYVFRVSRTRATVLSTARMFPGGVLHDEYMEVDKFIFAARAMTSKSAPRMEAGLCATLYVYPVKGAVQAVELLVDGTIRIENGKTPEILAAVLDMRQIVDRTPAVAKEVGS